MEITKVDYVRTQSRIVARLVTITTALRDIIIDLDDNLSETIERRNTSAFGLADVLTNSLCDYKEALDTMWKEERIANKKKGE